ncbi:hypothetical protein ACLG6S_11755 [Thermodesulfobacteriota bacterium B35]
MDRALAAGGLAFLERTPGEPVTGIVEQFPAPGQSSLPPPCWSRQKRRIITSTVALSRSMRGDRFLFFSGCSILLPFSSISTLPYYPAS